MLTGTTELALRALLWLGLSRPDAPVPPRVLAEALGCSPTYLSKTLNLLVRAHVLESVRGARGGVLLARAPESITLLQVVEACQGRLLGDYCRTPTGTTAGTCRYHRVMVSLHEEMARILAGCSLAELLSCPVPERRSGKATAPPCHMAFEGAAQLLASRSQLARKR